MNHGRQRASQLVVTAILTALCLPPAAEAAKVKVGDDPTLGVPNAPLVLVEFGDFQ
ncbi:MAG: hypothetical protein KDD47_05825 [Acidobacteria bacterium]|nr:hypothetical protein [Acidobacteriota bacterium]